jgi:uncharacterized phage-associated protein
MPVSANMVVDRLLSLGWDAGRPLTQIEVQKLLFFSEGWHLAIVGKPLFDEEFQAWANGPVIPSIYDRLKRYSSHTIPRSEIKSLDFLALGGLLLDLSLRVFETYKENDPGAMVGLTHLPGTPWIQVRQEHGLPKGAPSNEVVPKDTMKVWFSDVWRSALEPANRELVEASPEDYAEWAEASTVAA